MSIINCPDGQLLEALLDLPKISVITPSFNQGSFIGRCLDSVKTQSGVSIEHIVLDNCSTDSTPVVLRQYAESLGSVDAKIIIEPDQGQTAAINRGFELATGDILCWLNTDEWYEPDTLRAVSAFFAHNPGVDVIYGDCDFVDASGVVVSRKRERSFSRGMLLFYGCYIPSCATFIRRRVYEAGFALDTDFKVVMDFEWYVRMAMAGYRFAHIPLTLASFTWHDSNISKRLETRRKVERRLVQDRYARVPGPRAVRSAIFAICRVYWTGVRVASRVLPRRTLRSV